VIWAPFSANAARRQLLLLRKRTSPTHLTLNHAGAPTADATHLTPHTAHLSPRTHTLRTSTTAHINNKRQKHRSEVPPNPTPVILGIILTVLGLFLGLSWWAHTQMTPAQEKKKLTAKQKKRAVQRRGLSIPSD
jgi:hypothetical protein